MTEVVRKEQTNEVCIVGTVVENKSDIKDKDGRKYIRGNMVVKSMIPNEKGEDVENLFNIGYFSMEFKSDGKPNFFFDKYSKLDGFIGHKVKLQCSLEENKRYDEANDRVTNYNSLGLRFCNDTNASTKDCATFKFGGFVVRELYEITNKDGQVVGNRIEVGQSNYSGTNMSIIKFDVDSANPEVVQAIAANYETGSTITFSGNIVSVEETVVKETKQAFGPPIVETYVNSTKRYYITGGDEPMDGPTAYGEDDIKNYITMYKQSDLDIINKRKNAEAADNSASAQQAVTAPVKPRKSLI